MRSWKAANCVVKKPEVAVRRLMIQAVSPSHTPNPIPQPEPQRREQRPPQDRPRPSQ